MLVTEGRDGALLLELLDNDELPPAFQLEGEVRRHLVEQLELQPAGDSWRSLLDASLPPRMRRSTFVGVAEIIGGLLDGIFSLPND